MNSVNWYLVSIVQGNEGAGQISDRRRFVCNLAELECNKNGVWLTLQRKRVV